MAHALLHALSVLLLLTAPHFGSAEDVPTLRQGVLEGETLPALERIEYKNSELNRLIQRPLCFDELQEKYLTVLNRIIPENSEAVLLGVREDNAFGPAIAWLGETLGLSHALVHLAAQCFESDNDCARTAIRMLPPDGVVLFHGGSDLRAGKEGGMMGKRRAEQMSLAMGHRVVFLPQPLEYKDTETAKKDWEALKALQHNDTHLLVLSTADETFVNETLPGVFASVGIIACSAVNIGHMQLTGNRSGPAKTDVKFWRQERGSAQPEWPGMKDMLKKLRYMQLDLPPLRKEAPGHDPSKPLSSGATLQLALRRATSHGRPITSARAIITNDLDVVLLCLLVDVPVISVEETGSKIIEAIATVYGESERCGLGLRHYTADNIMDATHIARVLLGVQKLIN